MIFISCLIFVVIAVVVVVVAAKIHNVKRHLHMNVTLMEIIWKIALMFK